MVVAEVPVVLLLPPRDAPGTIRVVALMVALSVRLGLAMIGADAATADNAAASVAAATATLAAVAAAADDDVVILEPGYTTRHSVNDDDKSEEEVEGSSSHPLVGSYRTSESKYPLLTY